MIEEKIVEYMAQIETLAAQFTEPTIDLILLTARISAGQEALYSLLSLIIFVIMTFSLHKIWKINDNYSDPEYVMRVGSVMFYVILSVPLMIYGVLQIWGWVGLFYPEAYFVHQLTK